MTLLLFFFFGVLITVCEADKCCKLYVSPPSTVLVQLKNHNIIGTVPRQSPPAHYSSNLVPQSAAQNNYFLVNYHANGNPNFVYHTTPPQPQMQMQNGIYGANQASYWQQAYYQTPGYLKTVEAPQAEPTVQQGEAKKQANYYVSSAYFANSTEENENNSQQKPAVISQHQLGDYLRTAGHPSSTYSLPSITDETSDDVFSKDPLTHTPFPIVTPSLPSTAFVNNDNHGGSNNPSPATSEIHYPSTSPVALSINQENSRDLNTVVNKKQQPIKSSSTHSAHLELTSQTIPQHTTLLPNDALVSLQIDKNNNVVLKHNAATPSNSVNKPTTVTSKSQTQSSTGQQTSAKTSSTVSAQSSTTPINQQKNTTSNLSQTTAQTSSPPQTTSVESNTPLETSTIFTVMPMHRDAQRYGNNPYEENSAITLKSISTIQLTFIITYFILITIR